MWVILIAVILVLLLVLFALLLLRPWSQTKVHVTPIVPSVPCAGVNAVPTDLSRYQGKWYEQWRINSWFETPDLQNTTAEYKWNPDAQTLDVLNRGVHQTTGKVESARGVGTPTGTDGRYEVKFAPGAPPGSYVVLAHDCDAKGGRAYECAVVGSCNKDALWLLTRNANEQSPELKQYVQDVARRNGYSEAVIQKLVPVTHNQ